MRRNIARLIDVDPVELDVVATLREALEKGLVLFGRGPLEVEHRLGLGFALDDGYVVPVRVFHVHTEVTYLLLEGINVEDRLDTHGYSRGRRK